jgi:hypothetical protein
MYPLPVGGPVLPEVVEQRIEHANTKERIMRIAGCDAIIIFVILKYFIYSFSR